MRRRDFIRVVVTSAAAWPFEALAQQPERMRRIAVLLNRAENDPEGQSRLAAFQQGLQNLGWTDGGNVRIEIRWGEDDVDSHRRYAAELVALAPDVIVAGGTLSGDLIYVRFCPKGERLIFRMSAFGVKRTLLVASHMSASDPKRTYPVAPHVVRS